MAAEQSVSVAGFDTKAWCAKLAGTLDAVLAPATSLDNALVIAREVMREYDDAIAHAAAVAEHRENVIPIRPFSINTIIDDLGFTGR